MRRLCANVAAAFDAKVSVRYERRYPPLENDAEHVRLCADVAGAVVGAEQVDTDAPAAMGSEDFSFMLREKPGCYIRLGNGRVGEHGGVVVHNPRYDFNDEALPYGASYWARLAETVLKRAG